MNIFTAGDRIKVVNYPEHVRNGMEATVAPNFGIEDNPASYFIDFDDTVSMWMPTHYLELVTNTNNEYAYMSLEEQVAVLTEELYQVSRSYVAASTHRDKLQHDLEYYDDVMRDTKNEQNWCDEGTNKVIDDLNAGFKAHFIEPYTSDFEVEYEINASVMVRGTVIVVASSQDGAEEFFKDDIDSYIDPDQLTKDEVNNLGWDSIDTDIR